MNDALAASLFQALLGTQLGSAPPEAGNSLSLEGLAWRAGQNGTLEVGARQVQASSLRLASGPFTSQVDRLALHDVAASVGLHAGQPRLEAWRAARAECQGLQVQGPWDSSHATRAGHALSGAWALAPLGTAEGTIRAEIVDAHLLFDADVTIPIRHGQVNFNDATVEHVGPDSRMGVSRMGFYVDAPNGRSYLYQFTSAAIAGVEYERRGAMLGPWVTNRGRLQLQPFLEALLCHGPVRAGLGFTEQTRLLLDRMALSGELRLGDGPFRAPGLQGELAGHGDGRNAFHIRSQAVGRGFTAELPSLAMRGVELGGGGMQAGFESMQGDVKLRLFRDGGTWRLALDAGQLQLEGLRVERGAGP